MSAVLPKEHLPQTGPRATNGRNLKQGLKQRLPFLRAKWDARKSSSLSAVCSSGASCWTLSAPSPADGITEPAPSSRTLAAAHSGLSPHGAEQHNPSLPAQWKHSDSHITLCPKSKDQKLPNPDVFSDFNDLQIREIRRGQWESRANYVAPGTTTSCRVATMLSGLTVKKTPPVQGSCCCAN